MPDSKNVKLHYGKNTPQSLRAVLKSTVEDVVAKSNNKEMFHGLSIYLVEDYDDVNSNNFFEDAIRSRKGYQCGGSTINPIYTNGRKYIAIPTNNTIPTWKNLFGVINNTCRTKEKIKDNCLHELGHQFDYYYSSTKLDENLIDITNKFINKQITEKKFNELTKHYFDSQLSDSQNFKNAWAKDVNNLQNFSNLDKRYEDLGYFKPDWFVNYDNDKTNDIYWLDGIDNKEIELVSKERGEIFAQIFAYLLETNNNTKEKELIFSTYPNCVETVKEYINEYLGINL